MVFVAREMERRGMNLPLLIGGATTSRMHTAVKIAPAYSGPVIYVMDASRAAPVVWKLLWDERDSLIADTRKEYDDVTRELPRRPGPPAAPAACESAQRAPNIDFANRPKPAFSGKSFEVSARRSGFVYRLDAVLRILGIDRALPGDPGGR